MPPYYPRSHRSLAETVRAHFGLTQLALARLLGCGQAAAARLSKKPTPAAGPTAACP